VDVHLLVRRLREAGFGVASVTPASGGAVALAGLATLADGRTIFAKTLPGAGSDVFTVEAAGLRALTDLGGATTPEVLLSSPELLVLEAMRPRGTDANFWEEAGRMLARTHVSAVGERFGWHRDGWLGRLRQENAWSDDGHEFFAEHRLLRWLSEPLVEAAFDARDRSALERLCAALPDIVPAQPPVLNHGDLWTGNMVATASGAPVFIDPAVSYTWAESDLSMVWSANRPPASDRFFAAYAEVAPLPDGWQQRMPVLHLREVLSVIAHDDDDWGAVAEVRRVIAPFGRS
jgi:fructosamine-3-kinase